MDVESVQTVVIGGGQAGLAVSHELSERGLPHVVLDAGERVGDSWRRRWDSLRLFTPAKYDGLPDLPFPGGPWSFPGKDDVANYLETYALEMDLPVRLRTRVDRLESQPGGGFTAHLGAEAITSDNVVVATGTRGRTPHVPEFAGALAQSIRQLHSTEYRRPSQLSTGSTLVVGASHSGCEIAYEVAEHLPVTLCGRYTGNEPFAPGSGPDQIFTPLMVLVANHVLTRRTPPGRKVMRYVRGPHHGAPTARIKRRHLVERGVRWLEQRVTGVSEAGKPVLADGTVLDMTTVIWCTGSSTTSSGSICRSSIRRAGHASTAAWSTRRPGSSSAGSSSSTRSVRWCCRVSAATLPTSPAGSLSGAANGPGSLPDPGHNRPPQAPCSTQSDA